MRKWVCFFIAVLFSLHAVDYDVIVIGAGMAGIGAAKELQEHGKKVIIFEASNRVGGRVYTGTLGGTPIDFGANWIHGIDENPIMELAKKYHIETIPFDYDSIEVFSPTGHKLGPDEMDHLDKIDDALHSTIRTQQNEQDNDMPLQSALTDWINSYSPDDQLLAKFCLSSDIEDDYGANATDLSLYYYNSDSELKGGDNFIPNGYKQLVDAVAEPLSIWLNCEVQGINYSDTGVTVTTSQGTFTANYAICAIPLGVLKKGRIAFNPPLPAEKQASIDRLKMGLLHKTILRFPEVFWNREIPNMGYIPEVQGCWVYFVNLQKFNGAPILVGFNHGYYAEELEKLTDEQAKDKMMEVLRIMYGSSIPEPTAYVTARWEEDPLSIGSYSHIPVGASDKDYEEMAKPVQNLRFAGEATIHTFPGTVHGAYISGMREAQRIIQGD